MENIYANLENKAEQMRAKSALNPIIKIKLGGKEYIANYNGVHWVCEINGYKINFTGNTRSVAKKNILEYLAN